MSSVLENTVSIPLRVGSLVPSTSLHRCALNNIYLKERMDKTQRYMLKDVHFSVFIIVNGGNPQCPFAGGLKLSIPLVNRKHAPPIIHKTSLILLLGHSSLDMHMTFQVSAEYQLLKSPGQLHLAQQSSLACLILLNVFFFLYLQSNYLVRITETVEKMIYRQLSLPASSIPDSTNPGSETHRYLGLTVPKHFVKGIHGFGDQSHLLNSYFLDSHINSKASSQVGFIYTIYLSFN